MRKGLKIKALTLIAAWSIIFLHAVIPHNHESHQGASCHHIIHYAIDHSDHDCENNHGFESFNSPSEEHEMQICHFTTNLHLQDNLDQHFLMESNFNQSHLQIPTINIKDCRVFHSDSPPEYSLMPLRAPPASIA